MRALLKQVLELVPVDGSPVLVRTLMERAATWGITSLACGGALGVLCTQQTVAVEDRNGDQWARRVARATDFPLVARPPRRPPTSMRTRRARTGAPA